jgi:hypothetical protein
LFKAPRESAAATASFDCLIASVFDISDVFDVSTFLLNFAGCDFFGRDRSSSSAFFCCCDISSNRSSRGLSHNVFLRRGCIILSLTKQV